MSESANGHDAQLGQDGHDGQLEVEPLPYDGVASVAVGTGLWLVALLVMLPFADDLEADGHLWWVVTATVARTRQACAVSAAAPAPRRVPAR